MGVLPRVVLAVAVTAALVGCAPANDPGEAGTTVGTTSPPAVGAPGASPTSASLTGEQRRILEEDGGVVLAKASVPGGVVVAVGYDVAGGVAVELEGEPREVLTGEGFGGSGEVLGRGDSCNFFTSDEGWTVVWTSQPDAVVTVTGRDGEVVQAASPATVAETRIGVVLVDVGHTEEFARPSVEPGGTC